MKRSISLLRLIIITACSSLVIAVEQTDDTTIDEIFPTNNNGTSTVLIVRSMNLNPGELDTLLKFDLSSLPCNVTVKSATLRLYYFHWNDLDPVGRQLNVYRITDEWTEDSTTWNSRPGYNGTTVASATVPASYGWMSWDVTSSVQDFIDGTYSNYGWQIMDISTSGNSMIYFHSKEYGDSDYHPELILNLNVIFVDDSATGANDGTSWTDAYTTLQDALLTHPAVSGDEIWVAAGTYKPDNGGGKTPNDRTASFQLKSGVTLYGGFAGNENSPDQRDIDTNVTILSGDINSTGIDTDNSYHVVDGASVGSGAVIDGFTITAGNANGSIGDAYGGGLYCNGATPTVRKCIFTENKAQYGGGMFCFHPSASARISDCVFDNNSSANNGGGLYNNNADNKVVRCQFVDNTSDFGGGMYNHECDPLIVNTTFIGNTADIYGGGIFHHMSDGSMTNCVFADNDADDGAGLYNHEYSSPAIKQCSFGVNSAMNFGGGLYNYLYSNPAVTNCIFWGNTSGSGTVVDAQMYNNGSTPLVTYSCIQDSDPDDSSIPLGGAMNQNIDDDPLYRNESVNDLRLSGGSPCTDAGNNAAVPTDSGDADENDSTSETLPIDLEGNRRMVDGNCDGTATVDMGAYELVWVYLGDLDGDCDVDIADFTIFSSNWMSGK